VVYECVAAASSFKQQQHCGMLCIPTQHTQTHTHKTTRSSIVVYYACLHSTHIHTCTSTHSTCTHIRRHAAALWCIMHAYTTHTYIHSQAHTAHTRTCKHTYDDTAALWYAVHTQHTYIHAHTSTHTHTHTAEVTKEGAAPAAVRACPHLLRHHHSLTHTHTRTHTHTHTQQR